MTTDNLGAQSVYWALKESPRSWQEDFDHENGNYLNTCCLCTRMFIGHKRRVVCRECTENKVEVTNPIQNEA